MTLESSGYRDLAGRGPNTVNEEDLVAVSRKVGSWTTWIRTPGGVP